MRREKEEGQKRRQERGGKRLPKTIGYLGVKDGKEKKETEEDGGRTREEESKEGGGGRRVKREGSIKVQEKRKGNGAEGQKRDKRIGK